MGRYEILEQLDLKNCFIVFVMQITCLRRGGGVVRIHPGGGSGFPDASFDRRTKATFRSASPMISLDRWKMEA